MKKFRILVMALSVVMVCGVVHQASAQAQAPAAPAAPRQRTTKPKPKPAAPKPAAPVAEPAAPEPAPAPVQPPPPPPAPEKPKDGKVTIALIGEDRVADNPNKWQRSQMAAAFEDELVGSKRFRVVSQSIVEEAMKAQKIAIDASVD